MTVCSLTGTYVYDLNVVVMWSASIADPQAPTSTEIAAATSLRDTYNLTDTIGWEVETEMPADGLWGPFEEQRMAKQRVPEARLVFAADRSGSTNDIRSLLARGDSGYIIILPSGAYADYPAAPVNVYPVRVAQISQRQQLRTGQGSLLLVSFAIRARVGENVTVVGP